jgi:hypothetical protein
MLDTQQIFGPLERVGFVPIKKNGFVMARVANHAANFLISLLGCSSVD